MFKRMYDLRRKKETPEVQSVVDDNVPVDDGAKVLRYISEHEDSPISIREIARGSGVSVYRVTQTIRKMVEDKVIVKSESRPRHGTRYWVNRGPNSASSESEPSQIDGKNQRFLDVVETCVWQFVRDTRDTDVLMFLTWLETKLQEEAKQ